jgi:hypothetical protein
MLVATVIGPPDAKPVDGVVRTIKFPDQLINLILGHTHHDFAEGVCG